MHQEIFELNCSRTSLALDSTLVVVVEMSLSSWLVYAEVPGLERCAMKKMSVDEAALLSQLYCWRDEALTMQRYRIRHRISQIRFLDSALLHPVCEVGFCRGFSGSIRPNVSPEQR